MVKNKKLLETLFKCTQKQGACNGCFYGTPEEQPDCIFHLMNDILFFFGNPVPDNEAHVLSLDEVKEVLGDKKDHLCFAEFISSIHVAKPVIRTATLSGNFITLFDPQTNESDSFNIQDYYTTVRIWSSKPTDPLRNNTPWETDQYTDDSPINRTKTSDILRYVSNMTTNHTP